MPTRATKRGADRTPLDRDCDVLICGASFAGLAVARELAGTGAKVMVIDRYEIGERQTSACGVPTSWLEALDLMGAHQQTFGELVIHTPHTTTRYQLPWTFSTFDYRELCSLLAAQGGDFEFETAKVDGLGPRDGGPQEGGPQDGGPLECGPLEGGPLQGARQDGGSGGYLVRTDRGEVRAPLIVDALGWRRVLGGGDPIQPP